MQFIHLRERVKIIKFRPIYIGFMGTLGVVMAAEVMMALFALYSLKNKQYQDAALIPVTWAALKKK